jgi:hypothetical protein
LCARFLGFSSLLVSFGVLHASVRVIGIGIGIGILKLKAQWGSLNKEARAGAGSIHDVRYLRGNPAGRDTMQSMLLHCFDP